MAFQLPHVPDLKRFFCEHNLLGSGNFFRLHWMFLSLLIAYLRLWFSNFYINNELLICDIHYYNFNLVSIFFLIFKNIFSLFSHIYPCIWISCLLADAFPFYYILQLITGTHKHKYFPLFTNFLYPLPPE